MTCCLQWCVLLLAIAGCRNDGRKPTPPATTPIIECRSNNLRIRITLDAQGYRYSATPEDASQPVKLLGPGTMDIQGTHECAYHLWSFADGADRYVIRELGCLEKDPPEGTIGFFTATTAAGTIDDVPCLAIPAH